MKFLCRNPYSSRSSRVLYYIHTHIILQCYNELDQCPPPTSKCSLTEYAKITHICIFKYAHGSLNMQYAYSNVHIDHQIYARLHFGSLVLLCCTSSLSPLLTMDYDVDNGLCCWLWIMDCEQRKLCSMCNVHLPGFNSLTTLLIGEVCHRSKRNIWLTNLTKLQLNFYLLFVNIQTYKCKRHGE